MRNKQVLILFIISLIAIAYSPITKSVYNDWSEKKRTLNEKEKVDLIIKANSQGKKFLKPGNPVFPSDLTIELKPLSESLVSLKFEISPTHPTRASEYSNYVFNISFEDATGFKLSEFSISETAMSITIDDVGIPQCLNANDTFSMPIDLFNKIENISVSYQPSGQREEVYDELRDYTAAEIESKRLMAEEAAKQKRREEELARANKVKEEEMIREASMKNEEAARELRKAVWRKIKIGMSKKEVEDLLGAPSEIRAYGSFLIYNYESASNVMFDSQQQVVTEFNTPIR